MIMTDLNSFGRTITVPESLLKKITLHIVSTFKNYLFLYEKNIFEIVLVKFQSFIYQIFLS